MATTKFNCCQCPEPPGYDPEVDDPLPKYRNKCGCPTATLSCVSEAKSASLCGFSEYSGFASDPPKKYKTETLSASGSSSKGDLSECSGPADDDHFTGSASAAGTCSYDSDNPCSGNPVSSGSWTASAEYCNGPCSNSGILNICNYKPFVPVGATKDNCNLLSRNGDTPNNLSATSQIWYPQEGDIVSYSGSAEYTLSDEDTEEAALARATEAVGTECSSIYELRTTSFSFTKRTATYDVTATNLCPGRAYEGCVRIRKRKAYSGTVPDDPDTGTTEIIEWEDVEPDTITSFVPSAANTGEAVGLADGETEVALEVALPHEQGWEYEAVSAHVWPVSAGCDCPTDYVAPEEPAP